MLNSCKKWIAFMYTFAFLGLSFLYISHATPLFGTPNSQLLHCIVFCLSLFLLRIYISCRIVESLRIKLFNAYQEYKSSNVFLGWVERTNHLTTSGRKGFEKAKKFLFFSSFLELALSTSMIVTKLLQKQLQKQGTTKLRTEVTNQNGIEHSRKTEGIHT